MPSEELSCDESPSLESIVAISRPDVPRTVADGLKLAQDWGLSLDGDCIAGREAENRAKYGASSPKHRYCYEPRGITVEDLAKDWGFETSVVRAWVTAGKWDQVRADHLETVPLFLGGRLATGDLAAIKDRYVAGAVADGLEIQRLTMERIRARTEQTVDKATVLTLDKTSKEHLNDVLAFDTADKMIRTALQLPTKYSATMTQSISERRQVSHTTTHEPVRTTRQRTERTVQTNQLPSSEIITTREITVEAE